MHNLVLCVEPLAPVDDKLARQATRSKRARSLGCKVGAGSYRQHRPVVVEGLWRVCCLDLVMMEVVVVMRVRVGWW